MREEEISEKLGQVLKGIFVPSEAVNAVVESIRSDSDGAERRRQEQLSRTQQRLAVLRTRIDKMYEDKLDSRIDEEFWCRKNAEFLEQEANLLSEIGNLSSPASSHDRALTAKNVLELAHKAHFLYLTRNPAERGQLLKMVLLNCATDGVNLTPTYRKPFDVISQRAKNEEWSGREDLNLRPPGPEFGGSTNFVVTHRLSGIPPALDASAATVAARAPAQVAVRTFIVR
jgi:hypothetical protein